MRKQLITTLCIGLLATMPTFADKILDRGSNLNFGTVNVDDTETRDLNLTNRGDEDLTITGISFHSRGDGVYTTIGWNSGVIAPHTSQLVPIKFAPTQAGDYNVSVYIDSDKTNAGDRDRILLGKSIITPAVTRILDRGPHLHFGTVNVGDTATRELNLTNNGTEDLTITDIRVHENGEEAYTTTTWNSGVIAPHTSQLVPIEFAPTQAGDYNVAVYIDSDKTNAGDRDRILFGEGLDPINPPCIGSKILKFGDHLVFGDVNLGDTKTKILTIKNDGICDLNVTGITYSSGTDGKFTNTWSGGIIHPSSSQDVTITYEPTDVVDNSGLLYIQSDRTNTLDQRSRALIGAGI